MIDFRYHLVSLVSVFIALAIGVVLGAGPLQGSIGDTLTGQVQSLRDDKDALQQAVDNRDAALAQREEAIGSLGAPVTAGTLDGRSVAVISLPGAVLADVEALTTQLTDAGAAIATTVEVQPGWSDPDRGTDRGALGAQLVQYLDPRPEPESGAAGQLGALLGRALLSTGRGGVERDADGQTVLDALVEAELVTVQEDTATRADTAVVVVGSPDDAAGADDEQWAANEATTALALALAADEASDGAVVAGPPTAAGDGGTIDALRADADVSAAVSSVDVLDARMGRLGVVLALLEQLDGGVGQYGVGPGASGVLPPVPERDDSPGSSAPETTGNGTDGAGTTGSDG